MYKIDIDKNQIAALESKSFADLGFKERQHLQEWLANTPQALGEELLIIQKEFDGFDDTRERLDLLALDKDGNLVIIENKLDDSGRDVTWQALKYAGYCANLTSEQIVDIYERYITKYGNGKLDAAESITDFLEVDSIEEALLNRKNTQRLMFVAANFRKEVTNTILWLNDHEISAQCFRVTPYSSNGELFLSVDQIIPTPESKDYMIGMAAKEAEVRKKDKKQKEKEVINIEFWKRIIEAFKKSGSNLYDNSNPSGKPWLGVSTGVFSTQLGLGFESKYIRVSLYVGNRDPEINTRIFQELEKHKVEIEKAFGSELMWELLPKRVACRIGIRKDVDGKDKEKWDEYIEWFIKHMTKLENALLEPLKEVNNLLKNNDDRKE